MEPVSDDLGARLRRRIEDAGPITFAEFMESALYDPKDGFFEGGGQGSPGGAIGTGGDFVTSPHVGSLFGILLSRLIEDARTGLGDPDPFTVVEVGAGDGTLARVLADGLAGRGGSLALVERTARHRALLAEMALNCKVPPLPR